MTKKILVTDISEAEIISVKRRNTRGITTDAICITMPRELNQVINGISVRDNKTRSLVISSLCEEALKNRGEI